LGHIQPRTHLIAQPIVDVSVGLLANQVVLLHLLDYLVSRLEPTQEFPLRKIWPTAGADFLWSRELLRRSRGRGRKWEEDHRRMTWAFVLITPSIILLRGKILLKKVVV
jgi:hypothetical protein